ncbi:MAG: HEAT repeat domain-containing protein [Coriobacteriia bacterium]|nr:HEAT repeat domain-containing protein [Coriobacteriia bacterium]
MSAAGMEPIVRGLTAAAKALRLYPPSSPIPRQAVDTAAAALLAFLAAEPVLSLKVVRDGLAWSGATVAPGAPGATELADSLRDHGVAEVDFLPGVTTDDLLAFLAAVIEKPDALRERGGLAAVLVSQGVDAVRTADVSLTVVDPFAIAATDDEADEFLRQLAGDPDRISAWLSVAAKGDPTTLAASLADLARASGDQSLSALVMSLSSAFGAQDLEARDAIVGVSLDDGPARDLLGRVFAGVGTAELANTLCGGSYGRNMLSMSSALTRLPTADRMNDILAQVKQILPSIGHGSKELDFLEHMLEVRNRSTPETSLTDTQPLYRQAAELATVDVNQIAGARAGVAREAGRADDSAVATMLTLLDQQQDFGLYCRTLDALAGMVPALLERDRLDLAARVISELAARESRAVQPWPELTERLRAAIGDATSRRTMKALVAAAAADPGKVELVRDIMSRSSDTNATVFVEEALAHKPDGLQVAERVVGRRLVDMLAATAPRAQWFQIAPLVTRLAGESDARSQQAIESLLRRPDDASRREVATGLAAANGPASLKYLTTLVRDPSPEVALTAIRLIGRSPIPGAAAALKTRLDEIDADGKDFAIAREIIGALSRTPDTAADEALKQLATRRALIKRGHFAEVTDLAKQALIQRGKGAGR